ncbi:MAG: iron ABC transporter permease [Sphaerochaetaceae bacterium]|nr:iron ABC transporter permease [Sphaerochaetaceae bacterium]
MKRRGDDFYLKQALLALVITTIVFFLPIGAVFLRAFSDGRAFVSTFTDRYTWKILGFTLWESTLSAAISVLLALPFAVFFSRYTFAGRKAILTMSDAAFALPSILAILGFVIYYGNNGLVNAALKAISGGRWTVKILYSFKAILLAHVYLNFPVAFSLITTSLSSMPDKEEQASRLLGASEIKTFFKVTLPKVWGMVLATFTLIFLFCFPSFLIVMTLGGNPRYFTIEAEIYKRTYTDVNPAASAALAIFSFLVMTLLLVITGYGREEKKVSRSRRVLKKTKGNSKIKAIVLSTLIFLFMAPPLLSILYRAFFTKDNEFTLKAWKSIVTKSRNGVSTSLNSILNSLFVAGTSAFLAMRMASSIAIGAVRRKSRFIPLLTSLPMAVGSVSLGLGFAFISARIPSRSIVLAYTMVLLAHIVCILPFAVRTIMPGAKRIPQRLGQAAKTMGKEDRDIYRKIEYPLLKAYRRRAFAFAFALSLGEVNATLALSEGKVTTLPILIYKMIDQYNYQGASALAVILLTIAIVVFAIGETKGDENGIS